MPWRPLPRIAFGVCIYPFQPSSVADLPLEIGDELYIIEQGGSTGEWYRGYLVAPPSLLAGLTSVKGQTLEARVFSGIFPKCCVDVREVLGEDRIHSQDEATTSQAPASRRVTANGEKLEPQTNGVLTPSLSASPSPTRAGAGRNELESTADGKMRNGSGTAGSSSRLTLDAPKGHRMSSMELRIRPSDGSQIPSLPLSPSSIGFRDSAAPKPPAPVPMLKIGDETPTSGQEPLVDEIASCLREWHSTKLHELLLSRRYKDLDKMSELVQRLDTARRQFLHKVLTAHELRQLREKTVWDLVHGNKMLSGEVIVRSPSQRGRILTADDSPVEVTKLQSTMSLLDGRIINNPVEEHTLYHLLVDVVGALGETGSSITLAVHLCLKRPESTFEPLSEVFAMDVTKAENPAHALEGNMKTLFTDLSSADLGEG
ncbi:hypothetical protein LTS18_013929, partial [Coniosporium uncinatum]